MIRAHAKAAVLFAFGRLPGGPRLYRHLTRARMGTQATHVDKLARVFPGYASLWRERCRLDLEGKRILMHEGGWTVFPFLALFLLTGRGGVVTNSEGEVLDRYSERALQFAADLDIPGVPEERFGRLRRLLKDRVFSAARLIEELGGELHTHVRPDRLRVADSSVDLVHSGGVLEHYKPAELAAFLSEVHRVLTPGGISSHIIDHRDHLYHADKRYPFLRHWSQGDLAYGFWHGHSLGYHNRMLPAEAQLAFEQAGLEPLFTRRLRLPELKYVDTEEEILDGMQGLPRERLKPRFQAATDADLHTAAAYYVYRKPVARA